MGRKSLKVAMLEDDSDDRYLTEEIVDSLGFDLQLEFFRNSNELLSSLPASLPNIVLVDDNSTPENSLQVLQLIKQDSRLSHLPVIILSDSHVPRHREACYREGACAFVIKPRSIHETKHKIKTFFTYWFDVAEC